MTTILPAGYVGEAAHDRDGVLTIGEGAQTVRLSLSRLDGVGWWNTGTVSVYVRRRSDTLDIVEIAMAQHDGLDFEASAAEELSADERAAMGGDL